MIAVAPGVARKEWLAIAGGLIALAILYAPVLRELVAIWSSVPYYSHGFLVPLFSAYVVWERRREIVPARPAPSGAGIALAAGGVVLLASGVAAESVTLQTLSMPVTAGGVVMLGLGRASVRPLLFPLAFLVFMAPLPAGAIPVISLPLQRLAAGVAEAILRLLAIPVAREDLVLHLRGVDLEVSEACNGLRFLLAMAVVGVGAAWALGRSVSARAAIAALALAAAVAGNLVRVSSTALLVHFYGPQASMGWFHIAFGKVVYLATLAPLGVAVLLLRHRARRP